MFRYFFFVTGHLSLSLSLSIYIYIDREREREMCSEEDLYIMLRESFCPIMMYQVSYLAFMNRQERSVFVGVFDIFNF